MAIWVRNFQRARTCQTSSYESEEVRGQPAAEYDQQTGATGREDAGPGQRGQYDQGDRDAQHDRDATDARDLAPVQFARIGAIEEARVAGPLAHDVREHDGRAAGED